MPLASPRRGSELREADANFDPSREDLLRFGITRVGDLTGLDTIGIPVWFACRPNSRSLSVSQGKGLDDAQARTSAIMEAIEGAVAERPRDIVSRFCSYEEMQALGRGVVPLARIARCEFALFDPKRERGWAQGRSYVTGEAVHAPYELVGLDMRADFPWDRRAFRMSSAGIAAGTSFEFAALRAVLELIEHEATSAFDLVGPIPNVAQRARVESACSPPLASAISKVRSAGLEPEFYSLRGPIKVPVIACVIDWAVETSDGPSNVRCAGYGCRLDADEAALAALLEAVQSRLTDIAGARDDLEPERFETGAPFAPKSRRNPVSLAEVSSKASAPAPLAASDQEKLKRVAARVLESGADDIFLFPLPTRCDGIHVVRALAPQLGDDAAAAGRLDARALAALLDGQPS